MNIPVVGVMHCPLIATLPSEQIQTAFAAALLHCDKPIQRSPLAHDWPGADSTEQCVE